jgi:hypothetical protein
VFLVRYELNSYILLSRTLTFKKLNCSSVKQLVVSTKSVMLIYLDLISLEEIFYILIY